MEYVRIYLFAEAAAEMLAARIDELLENSKSIIKHGQALRYEVVNGFPVESGPAQPDGNIISLTEHKTQRGEGAISLGEFMKAMGTKEFKDAEKRAEAAGFHVYFQYVVASPGIMARPEAMFKRWKTYPDPLGSIVGQRNQCVEDLEILLIPIKDSDEAGISLQLTETPVKLREAANTNL